MFDRSVLFVGASGVGMAILAEALAQKAAQETGAGIPLRVHSATTTDNVHIDPVLLRAMRKLELETTGLSMKPLDLFAFAGAPRLDHVVLLGGAKLPAGLKVALGDSVDVRSWAIKQETPDTLPMGSRYQGYLQMAQALQSPVQELVAELNAMGAAPDQIWAHSA